MSSILVLGGAGYIGSHTVYELIAAGENVVVAKWINRCSRYKRTEEGKVVFKRFIESL